ncbi:MAG: hypothetical protein IKH84_02285, partial [Ottowia sp.]|nr:hypothetical protein [Ottowia sp.]
MQRAGDEWIPLQNRMKKRPPAKAYRRAKRRSVKCGFAATSIAFFADDFSGAGVNAQFHFLPA